MPGYLGYSGTRIGNYYSSRSSSPYEEGVTPLAPGEDPLAALSPELRALVLSTEPAPAPDDEVGGTDRLKGMLTGIAIGGLAGFLVANFTPRHQRVVGAAPMNVAASLTFAGIGAAIGGASGFLRGENPLDVDEQRIVDTTLGASTTPSLATTSHPAFASVGG